MQGRDASQAADPVTPAQRARGLGWTAMFFAAGILPHFLGFLFASITADLMAGTGEFAVAATRGIEQRYGSSYRDVSFAVTTAATVWYMWPAIVWGWRGWSGAPSARVRRRFVSAPLGLGLITFTPWLGGIIFATAATVAEFGRWSPDLLSQQVFSPLVSGFLASCTTYLAVEWLLRARVAPLAFPDGDLGEARDAMSLGVRSRLLLLMFAVGFTPTFTMLGLSAAASNRSSTGVSAQETLDALSVSLGVAFLCFLVLAMAYTLLLARSLTRPLGLMASALKRIEQGDLTATVQVESNDEIGMLAAGLNTMVSTLREREHILATFGRVVEPDVRDRLLAGNLEPGGEQRRATVLFCDLRGFTTLAEAQPPEQVLATLNRFFGVMADWAHECGGFVDKFIGDAILVVFGLFGDDDDEAAASSAAAALRYAEGVRERLDRLNAARADPQQPPLAVAIGIHSGDVLAGTIGAADRHEYTVVGDTVNVAARLQEQCKLEGVTVLASAATVDLAAGAQYRGALTARDPVSLRGRVEPVPVYAME